MRGIIYAIILTIAQCTGVITHGQGQELLLDKDFADPTVILAGDGKYYAYATQSTFQGKNLNIQVAVSDDLQSWRIAGDALPVQPSWANHHFWAPHVLYDHQLKKYVMFYSGESTDTTTGKCLGVAFSDSPLGPFTDKGEPLVCGEGFVNIDPMALIDPVSGKKLLYWGSGFAPIKVQELTADWKSFEPGTKAKDIVFPKQEAKYTNLLEGAWVDFHDGYFYIYYSGDNCCGERASYAVMVARSKKAIGPFVRLAETRGTGNSVVLEKDEKWNAPGHNSIIKDKQGQDWIFYHAIDRSNSKKGRVMCRSRVNYRDGWPLIVTGN